MVSCLMVHSPIVVNKVNIMRGVILAFFVCCHSAWAQMDSASMQGMDHSRMTGMDHSNMQGMDHSNMAGMVHDYAPIQVPQDIPAPQLALVFHRDAMSGVNLQVQLKGFALAPPERKEVEGQLNGHAHLYINGKKIQRLYGADVHLPEELFKPGVNLVMVSLNAHSHAVWAVGKKQLLASSFVNLANESLVVHSFTSSPLLR